MEAPCQPADTSAVKSCPKSNRMGGRVEKQQVNPWTWQDQFGFSQAWRVDGAQSIVFVSGQGPISPEGQLVGAGDFEAQTRQTLENLGAVLRSEEHTSELQSHVNLVCR